MIRTTSFHGDIDRRIAEIHAVVGAIVRGLHNVGAMFRQNSGEVVQGAGIIRQMHAEAHQASIFHQASLDDASQQRYVDITAAHQNRNALALQGKLPV